MSEECLLRAARADDLPAVLAIAAAWPALPPWTRAHFESELAAAGRVFVVAESMGAGAGSAAVVGYACLLLKAPEAEVTTVAVRPDAARRGIGRALIERLHAAAREAAVEVIGLEVSERNPAARALYERLGYRVVGRRAKYYHDGADALLMTVRL